MLAMRGGSSSDMSSSAMQPGNIPRILSGYQHNVITEPKSPATPWHTPRHTIKQEPAEEERNDSGVASGGSDLQSSPGSENSQELNMHNFPTSVNNIHHYNAISYNSTTLTPRVLGAFENNMSSSTSTRPVPPVKQQLHQALTKSDDENKSIPITPVTSPNSFREDNERRQEEPDALRRLQMSLEKNGMLSSLSPKMSDTSADGDKSDIDLEEYDEHGLRIPKINSHGKVKTFRCKQCDFIAVTKLDFWEHCKCHIKSDKLLTCPKCPFVTEYKHHLEYHMRNHYGSKPYKCTQCIYACVNKSMLNSHMKSHSNIYQYRCSDCTYATKYCHSLKLHLRKYSHKPAMVLNADGTPNPLPIIDIYGTRRGPKQKHNSRQQDAENSSPQIVPNSLAHFMLNPQMPLPFPFPFLGGLASALGNPLLLQHNLLQMAQNRLAEEQEMNEEDRPDSPEVITKGNPEPSTSTSPEPTTNTSPEPTTSSNPEPTTSDNPEVLDLSVQETDNASEHKPIKNRRKGMAFRLDLTNAQSEDEDEDEDGGEGLGAEEQETIHSNQTSDDGSHSSSEEKMEIEEPVAEQITNNNNKPDNYNCQFCCISFGDVVLYTMHMGYHGYRDPFTCNMCGERCNDKVSFFLHIARTPHS